MLLVAVTAATYLGNQVLVSRRAQRRRAEPVAEPGTEPGAGAPPPAEGAWGRGVGRGSGEVRQADAAGTELASTSRGANVK